MPAPLAEPAGLSVAGPASVLRWRFQQVQRSNNDNDIVISSIIGIIRIYHYQYYY